MKLTRQATVPTLERGNEAVVERGNEAVVERGNEAVVERGSEHEKCRSPQDPPQKEKIARRQG